MRLVYIVLITTCFVSCSVSKNADKNKITRPYLHDRTFANNIVVAHRGDWKKNNLPENSIASLKHAIELKCTGSEFDVRMTADDSLIINHDSVYNKMLIEETNYADLIAFSLSNGEKLPTLREYILAETENNLSTRLFCEIKPSEIGKERGKAIAAKVVRLIHELKAQHMVVYISFDYEMLLQILCIDPSAKVMYLKGDKTPEELKQSNISGAAYHFSVFQKNEDLIKRCRDLGLQIYVWTINDISVMDWLLANGVDFMATDEPELLFERIINSPTAVGWELVWSDEFNHKGLPDSSKWNYDVGGHGWGNNEKQFYLEKSIENSFVEKENLHIVALKKDYENSKYTSARLTTYQKFLLQYGKIEVMAKLPRGKGSWPAIWMLPESIRNNTEKWPLCGEIDIMEHVGKDPNVIHASLHTELYNHMKGTQISHFEKFQDVFDTFHKYSVEWSEEYIKFYIDDKLFFETYKGQNGRISTNEGWPFDKPYYLILNLAIGGNWGGEIDDDIFPNVLQIDYVRIYKKIDKTNSN